MILTVEDEKRLQKEAAERRAVRVPRLRAIFDGAIRYNEMLLDNPDWTDDECIAFAREWHAVAEKQYRERGEEGWNDGIPYGRNDITKANLAGYPHARA
jgi:hypothetical protein